jgi:transketolase C-terminal domain/subunit
MIVHSLIVTAAARRLGCPIKQSLAKKLIYAEERYHGLLAPHCGVSIGEDGPSQMALEDIAIFRAVHSSAVFYPSDAISAERLVETMARRPGINYLRTSRPKNADFVRQG